MDEKKCYICESTDIKKIKQGVRDNKNINVLKCKNCGLEFLSEISHNKDDFYQQGQMHSKTTFENWLKRTSVDDNRRFEYLKSKFKNKKILDFGAGSGNFVKIAQENGFDVSGCEIDTTSLDFYNEHNLNIKTSIEEFDGKFDVITMFHVLEHIENPAQIINELKNKLNDGGELIIEVPNSDDALLTLYKSEAFKNFTYWSCHIYCFNTKNLCKLLTSQGLKVIKTDYIQRYPYTNHIGWLKDKKAGGHTRYKLNNFIDKVYTVFLKKIKKTDTIIISAKM